MTPPERFHDELNKALAARPYKTSQGEVLAATVHVFMGSPGGSHNIPPAWVYRHDESGLEMVFQFYRNFTSYDLICKVTNPGQYPASGEGASIQLNSDSCVKLLQPHVELVHHGRVTVRSGISRNKLVNVISTVCPQAMRNVGISASPRSWPISLGNTGDIETLLDRLFLYAYCVEQAKRSMRHELLLPLVP